MTAIDSKALIGFQKSTDETRPTTKPFASDIRSSYGRFAQVIGNLGFDSPLDEIAPGWLPQIGRSCIIGVIRATSSVALVALGYYLYQRAVDYTEPLGEAISGGDAKTACSIIRTRPAALNSRSLGFLGGEGNSETDLAVVQCIPEDVRLPTDSVEGALSKLTVNGNAAAHAELLGVSKFFRRYSEAVSAVLDAYARGLEGTASKDGYESWLSTVAKRRCATEYMLEGLAERGIDEGFAEIEGCSGQYSPSATSSLLPRFKQSLSPERYKGLVERILSRQIEAARSGEARGLDYFTWAPVTGPAALAALAEVGEVEKVANTLGEKHDGKAIFALDDPSAGKILRKVSERNEYSEELAAAVIESLNGDKLFWYDARPALRNYFEAGNLDAYLNLSRKTDVMRPFWSGDSLAFAEADDETLLEKLLSAYEKPVGLGFEVSTRGDATDEARVRHYCAIQKHNRRAGAEPPEDDVSQLYSSDGVQPALATRMLDCLYKEFPDLKTSPTAKAHEAAVDDHEATEL